MKRLLPFMVLLLLLAVGCAPAPQEEVYVPGRILVKFEPGQVQALGAARVEAKLSQALAPIGVTAFEVPKGQEGAYIIAYMASEGVVYAERDPIVKVKWTPNDPLLPQQYHLSQVNAQAAWDVSKGSPNVVIAIVDTGVDVNHPDLRNKLVLPGYNGIDGSTNVQDGHGHGTHVAGIAAAEADNKEGGSGVCPLCMIYPVKVLSDTGYGSHSGIAAGIINAADKGVDIINMSLGGYATSRTLEDAVNYAANKGVLLVCAAGNENTNTPMYPAAYANCLGVAAVDSKDRKAGFSNYGSYAEISFPGVSIVSTAKGGVYTRMSGTSMASPGVAGSAGVLKALHPSWGPDRLRKQLIFTGKQMSDPIGPRVDLAAAVGTAPPTPGPATPTPTRTRVVPTFTPTPIGTPTATFTPSPTATPTATATPAPFIEVTPEAYSVGWVRGGDNRNFFGDDDIYSGWNVVEYIGAMQFNLPAVEFKGAELEIWVQTLDYATGGGPWEFLVLDHSIDDNWKGVTYTDLSKAKVIAEIGELSFSDLKVGRSNRLVFPAEALDALRGFDKVSIIVRHKGVFQRSIVSWDSGYGYGGLRRPPILRLHYEAIPTPTPKPPQPTVTVTATPKPTPTAEGFWMFCRRVAGKLVCEEVRR